MRRSTWSNATTRSTNSQWTFRKVRRAETGTRAPVAAGEVVAEAPHRAAQERREAGDRGNPGSAPDAAQDVQGIADRGRGRAGRLRVSSRRFPAFDAVAARGDDQVGRAAEERIPAVAGRARSSRRALQQERGRGGSEHGVEVHGARSYGGQRADQRERGGAVEERRVVRDHGPILAEPSRRSQGARPRAKNVRRALDFLSLVVYLYAGFTRGPASLSGCR